MSRGRMTYVFAGRLTRVHSFSLACNNFHGEQLYTSICIQFRCQAAVSYTVESCVIRLPVIHSHLQLIQSEGDWEILI